MFLLYLFSNISLAFEDEDSGLFGDDFVIDDIPIVLTASRLLQPITETPTAMTIIDRKMIKKSSARTVPELFKMVPGITVGYVSGNEIVVTYHGMSDQFSRRMQILIDGRAVYLPDLGGPEWSSLPVMIENIERIEITRGSNAATYGSNSFMGVINIITQHSSKSIGFFARKDFGDDEVNSTMLSYSGKAESLDYRISMKTEESNYFSLSDSKITEEINHQGLNSFSLRADYQLTSDENLTLHSGFLSGEKNYVSNHKLFTKKSTRQYTQLQWSKSFTADNEVQIQAYYSKLDNRAQFEKKLPITTSSTIMIDNNITNQRYDIEAQYTFATSDKLRGVIGASYREDRLWSPYSFNSNKTFSIAIKRLFATLEYRINPKWLAHLGVMTEDHGYVDVKNSPRLSSNYQLSESQHLRVGISRAYRAPLTFEKFANLGIDEGSARDYEFIVEPNINLAPEKITSIDIGYIFKRKGSPITLDLRIYREKLENIITPYAWFPTDDLDPGAASFDNKTNVTVDGLELNFEYNQPNWATQLNYSYTDIDHQHFKVDHPYFEFIGETDPSNNIYQYDKSAPLHKASFMLSNQFSRNLQTAIIYHYVDTMYWQGGLSDPLDSYGRLDLTITADSHFNNNPVMLKAVLQNITSNEYSDFRDENVYDRSIYISLTAKIQ